MFGSGNKTLPRQAQNKLRKPPMRMSFSPTWVLAAVATASFITWVVMSMNSPKSVTPVETLAEQAQALEKDVQATQGQQQAEAQDVTPENYQPMIYEGAAKQVVPVDGAPLPELSSTESKYMIQLGAYPTLADAQKEKARVALMGFEAQILLPIESNSALYRLQIGPFVGMRERNRMLNRLRREKIENIAVTTLNETSQTVTVAGEKLQARIVRETGIEGRTNTPSRSTADVKQPAEKVPAPPSVKQTSLVPKPSASASPSSSLPTGDYWRIQMGSFPDEAGAKLQISKLAKTNVTAEILPAEVNGKTVYRVMSKPLTTEAQVESLRALLSLNGINHFVKRFK